MSSSFLERGYITYSNQSKEKILHVKPESLQLHDAVSDIIAKEMAEGALKESLAQISISVTGLAGEDKIEKTQGEAWVGIAIIDNPIKTYKINFKGKRSKFIDYLIINSLDLACKRIEESFKK